VRTAQRLGVTRLTVSKHLRALGRVSPAPDTVVAGSPRLAELARVRLPKSLVRQPRPFGNEPTSRDGCPTFRRKPERLADVGSLGPPS